MTTSEATELAKMLGAMAELYGHKLTDAQLALYIATMADFPLASVRAAAKTYMRAPGSKWFPKPGELVELIDGNPEDRANQAWLALGEAIRWVGAWKPLVVADRCWAKAVEQVFGGWPEACEARGEMNEPTWQAKRKEFASAYRWHRAHQDASDHPAWMSGLTSRANVATKTAWRAKHQSVFDTIALLSADYELQERRVEMGVETGRPLLPLSRVLALPDARRTIMTPAMRALMPGDEPVTGAAVEKARADFLAQLAKMAPRTMDDAAAD